MADVRAGAYGLTVRGLDDPIASGLNDLTELDQPWPDMTIVRRAWDGDEAALPENLVDESRGVFRLLGGGWLEVDRATATTTFHLADSGTDRDVAHPLLAPVGAIHAWWSNRETFHCAGFVSGGRAWALAADKEAGKSTLAALLALRGVPVLADDMLVLAEDLSTCLAGPRLVDLRPPTANHLRTDRGVEFVDVRGGLRARLDLAPVPLITPFARFVLLVDDPDLDGPVISTVPVRDRMERLAAHRGMRREPNDPRIFLDLATRPVLELRRPKRFDQSDDVVDLLLARTAAA